MSNLVGRSNPFAVNLSIEDELGYWENQLSIAAGRTYASLGCLKRIVRLREIKLKRDYCE